ncbi:MAG: ribonuclease HII [Myxococcota bacterium]
MSDPSQTALFEKTEPRIGELEDWCISRGHRWVIGVDEAGRGPLAGPVHAAAVAIDLQDIEAEWLSLLDDSKQLDREQREDAYELIREHAVAWSIETSDRAVIDDINILQATHRAMEQAALAVGAALEAPPDYVFIDGNMPVVALDMRQKAVVKGDARSLCIAAASILAKVSRDAVMREFHEHWPEYGFASNKGYPTRQHRDAIVEHGPCRIHRRTFGGVREHVGRLRDG